MVSLTYVNEWLSISIEKHDVSNYDCAIASPTQLVPRGSAEVCTFLCILWTPKPGSVVTVIRSLDRGAVTFVSDRSDSGATGFPCDVIAFNDNDDSNYQIQIYLFRSIQSRGRTLA